MISILIEAGLRSLLSDWSWRLLCAPSESECCGTKVRVIFVLIAAFAMPLLRPVTARWHILPASAKHSAADSSDDSSRRIAGEDSNSIVVQFLNLGPPLRESPRRQPMGREALCVRVGSSAESPCQRKSAGYCARPTETDGGRACSAWRESLSKSVFVLDPTASGSLFPDSRRGSILVSLRFSCSVWCLVWQQH
jgi:hypothetical protein